jgi:hypothetical protein
MLRRLNRLFPPPDPEKLAQQKARKFFHEFYKFATDQEFEELNDLFDRNREEGITDWEQLAERDPQRYQRVALLLKTISGRQASGVKLSWEERLPPWLHGRARALARLEARLDQELSAS